MSIKLDVSQADRLARIDPSLAALPRVLDECAGDDAQVLHDLRWTPGHGCRLTFADDSSFVAVQVDGHAWTRHDWLDDADIPSLRAAADPVEVARRLEWALGEPVEVLIHPVRYRAGSRGVLQYDVLAASGPTTLYAKALPADSYNRVVALHAELAARGESDLVSPMVAGWPDLHVVVTRAVSGSSASSVLGDAGVPSSQRARIGRDLGRLLARFHELDVPGATTWTADQQVGSLADAMAAVELAEPAMGVRLGAVLDTLAATVPAPGPPVLAHGSFRPGQVVISPDGRPFLLDTDEISHGDRERDLGIALAHLTWQSIRQPHHHELLTAARRDLLATYFDIRGGVRRDALRWWRAASLLQVAVRRFRRLEVGSWPLVDALADAAEDLTDSRPPTSSEELLDVERAADLLEKVAGVSVAVESAELVGTAPERRRVVRYGVRGLVSDEVVPVIGKEFAEARPARLSYLHLRLMSDGPFGEGPFRVPDPVGLTGEHQLLFYREDPGTRLDTRIDRDGVVQAAHWLALMHTSEIRLPRELSLTREAESTRQWADLIATRHPRIAGSAKSLASRWVDIANDHVVDAVVPIHKDFHPGHVLIGDHTCVIDLDEARMGDPAFDVAHFATYLDLWGARHALVEEFVTEYAEASGWVDQGSYAPFCAYSCLKIAKQAVVGSGPFRDVRTPRRMAFADAALNRGAAWLGTSWQGWS